MLFVISLLYILSARISMGQELHTLVSLNCPEYGLSANPSILFIMQTRSPRDSWEAIFVITSEKYNVLRYITALSGLGISFYFDKPVEVYIEHSGTRTKLKTDNNESVFSNHYGYDNSTKSKGIFKMFVRNTYNSITPHLLRIEIRGLDECTLIIPYELIGNYKIKAMTNNFHLLDSNDRDAEAVDLISFIKYNYETTISSYHTAPVHVQGYSYYKTTTSSTRTVHPHVHEQGNSLSSSCGKRIIKIHSPLVAHGQHTSPGKWPWHAALFHITDGATYYKCGGSLITRNAVLTAAHCVFEEDYALSRNRIVIKLGLHKKTGANPNAREFDVQQVIPHENFNRTSLINDIAIIQLKVQANLNTYIQLVCLWPKDKIPASESAGEVGYVLGWGVNEKHEEVEILTEARMPVVSHEDCLYQQNQFQKDFLNTNNFCAGFRNGTSVCNGDSGGGMFFEDKNGIFRIRGIVSVGKSMGESCDTFEYIIFTNVGRYLDWIEYITTGKF